MLHIIVRTTGLKCLFSFSIQNDSFEFYFLVVDANKIKRIIKSVGKKLDEKFHSRVKENGVHIIGFDGKHLKIREVEQDSNGHYHQVKNVVDTIGQFCRFSISYYLSN